LQFDIAQYLTPELSYPRELAGVQDGDRDVAADDLPLGVGGVRRVAARPAGVRAGQAAVRSCAAAPAAHRALFGLVWLRKREDLTVLGAGFGISRATAHRYRDEVVAVLAAQAPDLTQALQRLHEQGWAYVILDGKIVDTDRCRVKTISNKGDTIDLWYSGKRHDFGGGIRAVMRPDGLPIWVSAVEPGSVHELIAAHEHALGALYAAAARGLPTLADPGYESAGHGVYTPFKKPPTGAASASTTAPTVRYCGQCDASVNAASLC
jgi:hypothetical protein